METGIFLRIYLYTRDIFGFLWCMCVVHLPPTLPHFAKQF